MEVASSQNDFSHIGTIESLSSDNANQYQLFDRKPSEGLNFYRLKVIKKDGDFYYSTPRQVNFNFGFESIYLYPNPTNGVLRVDMGKSYSNLSIRVTNELGQQINSKEINISNFSIDISRHSAGVYYLEILSDDNRAFFKVIKHD